MILDISDSTFRNIFQDENLYLPIRWSGEDFYDCVEKLFNYYCKKNERYYLSENLPIKRICSLIKKSIKHYLDGFPAKAYNSFSLLMNLLQDKPLRVYNKSHYEILEGYDDKLNLFRVAIVDDNIPYNRTRIFHTPYNLRSKVSTCRYSIAGFPSLYLGTSLELCCEEVRYDPHQFAIASKFKIERSLEYNDTEIRVIELALKPQDFWEEARFNDYNRRSFDEVDLTLPEIRNAYLLWYPLIAACSFIRTNKNYPFAPEYIVPQLLMQWVRSEMSRKDKDFDDYDKLIGIRYFSCSSVKASDMGFNYVFPVSGQQISSQKPYCPVLAKAFRLTKPHYLNEYHTVNSCEHALICDNNLDFIDT